jgi:hypothetical protein
MIVQVGGTASVFELEASARLIAAAHDLLRELQAFVDAQEKHFGDATATHIRMSTLAITARAAIEKATHNGI